MIYDIWSYDVLCHDSRLLYKSLWGYGIIFSFSAVGKPILTMLEILWQLRGNIINLRILFFLLPYHVDGNSDFQVIFHRSIDCLNT